MRTLFDVFDASSHPLMPRTNGSLVVKPLHI
jgi:hypothetical protein